MSFLRNVWYVAAWSDELAADAPIARTIIGQPLLLWRQSDGALAALADRCPHRFAPLSMGKCAGATIRCGYHGLVFDAHGRCVENPHGPIVGALSVPAYPLVERHGIAWIWMGERDAAAPSKIPDLSFIDEAGEHAISYGYMRTAAGHRLFEDNILDLSHADYLHPATLGGGTISRSTARVEQRGDTVFVQWLAHNDLALPIMRSELPSPDTLTDTWLEVTWYPSGVMALDVGSTPVGRARDEGILTKNAHIMTPETETSTHYFYCNFRNYKMDDAEYNAAFAAGLRVAFETEDKPMIEAQQRRIGPTDLFALKPALLGIDSASTRARRVYDQLLTAEAS